jgi:hypothetical protein
MIAIENNETIIRWRDKSTRRPNNRDSIQPRWYKLKTSKPLDLEPANRCT